MEPGGARPELELADRQVAACERVAARVGPSLTSFAQDGLLDLRRASSAAHHHDICSLPARSGRAIVLTFASRPGRAARMLWTCELNNQTYPCDLTSLDHVTSTCTVELHSDTCASHTRLADHHSHQEFNVSLPSWSDSVSHHIMLSPCFVRLRTSHHHSLFVLVALLAALVLRQRQPSTSARRHRYDMWRRRFPLTLFIRPLRRAPGVLGAGWICRA